MASASRFRTTNLGIPSYPSDLLGRLGGPGGQLSGRVGDATFSVTSCPWDLDDNSSVGASDLFAVLASWGPCKGCPADFDANGNVSASTLLANWGPFP